MEGVNVLALEAVRYLPAGRIVAICIIGLVGVIGLIGIITSIIDPDEDSFAESFGVVTITAIFLLVIIFTRPQKIYYYMTIQDSVNYAEFSKEYKVEKQIGDIYIATKVEKDD